MGGENFLRLWLIGDSESVHTPQTVITLGGVKKGQKTSTERPINDFLKG